jgi:MFS transporter, DHA3 family, macrolide efflux protein
MSLLSNLAAQWDSFCSVGIRKFLMVWFGQLVSLTGSGITSFILGLWVYQNTNSVAKFSYLSLAASLPIVLFSPVAGALVDRWDRKKCMLLGDSVSALCVLIVIFLLAGNRLQLWEVYVAVGTIAMCSALQWPAYGASVSLLVDKSQYSRANGMLQLGQAVGRSAAPFLSGILLLNGDFASSLTVDFLSFLFALISLLLVRFPKAAELSAGRRVLVWRDVLEGWRFVFKMSGLYHLMILFAVANFFLGAVTVLVTPMVLGFASAHMLGIILSIAAMGMVLGGLTMSVWSGPVRPTRGVIGVLITAGFSMASGGLRPSAPLVAVSAFVCSFCITLANIFIRNIIQTMVPQQLQGRIFAFLTMIAFSSLPLAYAVAGPLAEKVFEPAMSVHGVFGAWLGPWLGVGPGRGIGLIFVVSGIMIGASALIAYCSPPLRELDHRLPDAKLVSSSELLEVQALNRPEISGDSNS